MHPTPPVRFDLGTRLRFARRMKVKGSGLVGGSLQEFRVARATTS
jgi:hypothetical protein